MLLLPSVQVVKYSKDGFRHDQPCRMASECDGLFVQLEDLVARVVERSGFESSR